MNVKRFFGAAIALFVFLFIYDWIVHGVLLMNTYMQTAQLWRPEMDMKAMMPLCLFLKVLFVLWLTYIFTQLYKNGGVKHGVQFGIYIGVLLGLSAASSYIWLPIPASLAWGWLFSNVIMGIAGGAILGAIYRKGK